MFLVCLYHKSERSDWSDVSDQSDLSDLSDLSDPNRSRTGPVNGIFYGVDCSIMKKTEPPIRGEWQQ